MAAKAWHRRPITRFRPNRPKTLGATADFRETVEVRGAAAIVIPSIASIFAAIWSRRASERSKQASDIAIKTEARVVELDIKVDGRLSQLLTTVSSASHAQGMKEERDFPGRNPEDDRTTPSVVIPPRIGEE